MKKNKLHRNLSPYLILLLGFACVILVGTLLFLLPFSTKQGQHITFIDSLFLSTSAVCVTGLVSTPIAISELLTPFGYFVLFSLIEVGGLGFITIVTFVFSFVRKKVNISTSVLLKEAMNQNSYQELISLAKKIVLTSLAIQGIGVVFVTASFLIEGFGFFNSIGNAIFHVASSFNNAGFDILGDSSLMLYKSNFLLMIVTALLIIFGGLGFVVIFDLLDKKKYKKLSIHSKIVLKTTIYIIVFGTLFVKLSDWSHLSWMDSFLQVVFARTAGFATINLATLGKTTILIISFIMFVGGSPVSIAGGVKTTTLYTIFKSIVGFGKGKKHIIAYNREITSDTVMKSYILVTVSLMFISLMCLLLSIFNPDLSLKSITFEAISAFATVGTSLGITPLLSSGSKCVIIILMYFGRLGPITFISLLNRGYSIKDSSIGYIEEKIIIG